LDEIPGIAADFRSAAANAIEAGFDGVEIHGANGYLLDQFLRETANTRTDAYGGSIENRARLLIEVTAAVASEIGAHRTGVRLSPVSPAGGVVPASDEQPQYNHVVEKLDGLGIAYIHVVEGVTAGPRDGRSFDFDALRKTFRNTYIANNGYDLELASSRLAGGKADLVALGRPFIANPDLVERLKNNVALAQLNPATLYGGGAEGYTDYPAAAVAAEA
jgi:N-ethylmaleimide reductase